jgi:hypothetical protein
MAGGVDDGDLLAGSIEHKGGEEAQCVLLSHDATVAIEDRFPSASICATCCPAAS